MHPCWQYFKLCMYSTGLELLNCSTHIPILTSSILNNCRRVQFLLSARKNLKSTKQCVYMCVLCVCGRGRVSSRYPQFIRFKFGHNEFCNIWWKNVSRTVGIRWIIFFWPLLTTKKNIDLRLLTKKWLLT